VLVGAYALGKAQRVITELRGRGHHDPIYIHGAIERLCELYESFGVELGELRPGDRRDQGEMAGHIVIAPPGALNDRWSRRLPDPVTAMASGWMRIRQRARQRNVELPLIISDHADWDELTQTIRELAPTRSVDHPRPRGRADALVHDPPDQGARAEPGRL
jgi:putative mRNA 3-end processing factor